MSATPDSLATQPLGFLKLAYAQVPAVRYALGVGGIAAVVAIVLTLWKLDPWTAAIGTLAVLVLMVVLVGFAAFSASAPSLLKPISLFMAWAFMILAVLVAFLFVACAFFDKPKTLPCLLKDQCTTIPLAAKKYKYATGFFQRTNSGWVEQSATSTRPTSVFTEFRVDSEYIYLVDPSRMKPGDTNNAFHLRIPIKGGAAQWSWQNPLAWIDLHIVEPEN